MDLILPLIYMVIHGLSAEDSLRHSLRHSSTYNNCTKSCIPHLEMFTGETIPAREKKYIFIIYGINLTYGAQPANHIYLNLQQSLVLMIEILSILDALIWR
ncbi:hypothetical protein F5B21DRAFT_306354 [Xylaria acuta]|nr:hypothetical protein F5B21DRAFT_306354 [Xylaria acuta]